MAGLLASLPVDGVIASSPRRGVPSDSSPRHILLIGIKDFIMDHELINIINYKFGVNIAVFQLTRPTLFQTPDSAIFYQ